MDVFLRQERILTSRTKAIVKHLPTRSFFLNTYSIHNYIHIKSVLPEALHDSPIRVADVNAIRKLAVTKLKEKRANQSVTSTDAMSAGPENQRPAFEHATKKPQVKAKGKAKAKSPPVASHHVASPPTAGPPVASHSAPGPSVASSSVTGPFVASHSISGPSIMGHFAVGRPPATGPSVSSRSLSGPSVTGHFAVGRPPATGPSVVSHPVTIPSTASHFPTGLSSHFLLQPVPQSLPTPYMVPAHIYSSPMSPPASGAAYHPSNHPFVQNVHFTSPLSVPQFSQPGPAYRLPTSAPSSHFFTENALHDTTDPSLVNPYQVPYLRLTVNGQYSTTAAPGAPISMGPHQRGDYPSTATHYNSSAMSYAPPH